MNNNNSPKYLSIIIIIVLALIGAAVGWGALNNKQSVSKEAIDGLKQQKLDKEVFQMYLQNQDEKQARTDIRLDRIDTNIEIIKEKLK